jgi:hypothetical protein
MCDITHIIHLSTLLGLRTAHRMAGAELACKSCSGFESESEGIEDSTMIPLIPYEDVSVLEAESLLLLLENVAKLIFTR